MNIALSSFATLTIIFVVPILVYGLFVKFGSMKEPEKKLSFMISVLVQKIGTSIGFVWIFVFAHEHLGGNWLLYGLVWAVMFAIVEIGQAIGADYSIKEAIAGIISEAIYFPLAAFVISKLFA